jgi:hypothetical protein
MSHALRNAAGVVIGACDSLPLNLSFDRNGRRPWRARKLAADRSEADIGADAGPKMTDSIKGYKRLPIR